MKKEYIYDLGPTASKFDKIYFGNLNNSGFTLEEIEKRLKAFEIVCEKCIVDKGNLEPNEYKLLKEFNL